MDWQCDREHSSWIVFTLKDKQMVIVTGGPVVQPFRKHEGREISADTDTLYSRGIQVNKSSQYRVFCKQGDDIYKDEIILLTIHLPQSPNIAQDKLISLGPLRGSEGSNPV